MLTNVAGKSHNAVEVCDTNGNNTVNLESIVSMLRGRSHEKMQEEGSSRQPTTAGRQGVIT